MSLLDSLLLDPDPAPFEVWIALRADGQKGSGTQADPYDGSTIKTAPLSITTLSRPDTVNTPLEALAVTSQNHGFVVNDVVIISTGTANGDWWDGTFPVTATPRLELFQILNATRTRCCRDRRAQRTKAARISIRRVNEADACEHNDSSWPWHLRNKRLFR